MLANQHEPLAKHLRERTDEHKDRWNKSLREWFVTLQMQMRNNVAYDIALEEIAALEASAREYAEAAYAYNPENPTYIETLGLVKLRFANTLVGGKDEDIKRAVSLFDRAIYLAREKNELVTVRIAQLHQQQALEMLKNR